MCSTNEERVARISELHQQQQSVIQSPAIALLPPLHTELYAIPPYSKKLRILCLHGFRQNAKGFKGRTSSLAKKLKHIAELIFIDAPHQLPFIYHRDSASSAPPPSTGSNKKFAWFVQPGFRQNHQIEWILAANRFDSMQYKEQNEGCDVSISYLRSVFARSGPFDGVLGFSQGAAAAAMLCALKIVESELCFRFVILCSGFAVHMGEERGSIQIPSLHIFGRREGGDRQICNDTSRDLASFFHPSSSVLIEHDSGHIIPTTQPYIDAIRLD